MKLAAFGIGSTGPGDKAAAAAKVCARCIGLTLAGADQ